MPVIASAVMVNVVNNVPKHITDARIIFRMYSFPFLIRIIIINVTKMDVETKISELIIEPAIPPPAGSNDGSTS